MVTELNSFEQLQQLVKECFADWERYGDVRAVYLGDLVLFNYTNAAQFNDRWNWFERVSRGLILNANSGEILARPFDKFFNWFERGRATGAPLMEVTEKVDGSLGILYRHDGTYKIATRGSFDGEQALWASEFLNTNYNLDGLPRGYTLLFEIVYPDNRIVVDYGDEEDLVLLAIRNIATGEYCPYYPHLYDTAQVYGFSLPKFYNFNSVNDILELKGQIEANQEGWVLLFADGQRFKVKGDRYVEVHRLVTNATFRRVLESVTQGTFDTMIKDVPDEFLEQILEWRDEIETKAQEIEKSVSSAFSRAPKSTRKEFALWAKANHQDLMPYLFLMLDDRIGEVRPLILKKGF